jgi:hypothetical protein
LNSRALAITALCSALLGLSAAPAEAARLGPFCLSINPFPTFAPVISFPGLTLQVFLDAEPYGQVFLGAARTLGQDVGADTPSFVAVQVVGRFIRVSVVGTSLQFPGEGAEPALQKPAFSVGGELDTRVGTPSGTVNIIITAPGDPLGPVGSSIGVMSLIPCP